MKKLIHKELLTTGNKCFVSHLEKKKGLNPQKNENKNIIHIPHLTLRKATVCKHLAKEDKRKKQQALVKLQINFFVLCTITTRDEPLKKTWEKQKHIQGFIT